MWMLIMCTAQSELPFSLLFVTPLIFQLPQILFVDFAGFCRVSAFSYSDGCYLFLRKKKP